MSAERRVGRRRFLELGGLSLASMLAGCDSRGPMWARGALRFAERRNESVERLLLTASSRNMAHNSAPSAGAAFPAYFVSPSVPRWDAAALGEWTLEVSGAVRKPVRLTLGQLTALPRVAQRVDHFCVEGWTAVARWTGVRVSELARLAQATEDAHYVDFQSFDDGYHESWDMESAMHPQTLVAYALDGTLLGPYHGAPARVHSPIKLGYKNTKYLTRVVFLPSRNGGYWSDQGYEWFGGT